MNELRFPRWVAAVGVIGGVAIALGLPWITLAYGNDLGGARVVIVILSLIFGAGVAGISAVVGITIPTAVSRGISLSDRGIRLGAAADCCPPKGQATEAHGDSDADEKL